MAAHTTAHPHTIGAVPDDPRDVTGPVAVVTDPGLQVEVRKGCHVVSIDGGLDEALANAVAMTVRGQCHGSRGIIVDLDCATLLDPDGIRILLRAVTDEGDAPVCLSTSRLSARLVLGRWGIAEAYAVFASVADALQTLVMADDGYGAGWVAGAPAQPSV